MDQVLIPGRLIQVGDADVHIGGCVSNTGLGLKVLGANVKLMGKVGNDDFGKIVLDQISQHTSIDEMIISEGESTSYTIPIAPQGIDRIFLHNPGPNNTFTSEDINYDLVKDAKLFHFGYPPLMRNMYQDNGEELIKIFKKVKELGVATSLDMAGVDENSDSGQADWEKILRRLLPYVDFFVPSIEEITYMVDKSRYNEWVKRADGRDMTTVLHIEEDIVPVANKLVEMGAKVVLLKCGAPGLYFSTTNKEKLETIGGGLADHLVDWDNINHFEFSYKPDRILSGTGAGDTTIAAFLYSVIRGVSWQRALGYATATGASCITEYDAISGLISFEEIDEKIQNGWEKQYLIS